MIEVGRFLILQPMEEPPEAGRMLAIHLCPGWAFGDGSHPSTRNMLLELPYHARPGMKVLDYGTGNGILAIAAARLGATVIATEADRPAFCEAAENVRINRLQELVTVKQTAGEAPAGRYDLILANMGSEDVLRRLSGRAPVVLFTDGNDQVKVHRGPSTPLAARRRVPIV